jgi:hypothetical protein
MFTCGDCAIVDLVPNTMSDIDGRNLPFASSDFFDCCLFGRLLASNDILVGS